MRRGDEDDEIPRRIGRLLDLPIFRPGMVLEGGSIDVNGAGTVLTTESCLLNGNRNPGCDRAVIERQLRDNLAVDHIVWLGDGIVGDDTDGHVDDITRFVGPRTVVTAIEDDASDPNYRPLRENLARLERAVDQDGRSLEVLTLPMPPPLEFEGERLPASYANFYIANDVVIVPTFRSERDQRAVDVLQQLFPSRRAVGLDAVDLVRGLGAFHCISQQQPAA